MAERERTVDPSRRRLSRRGLLRGGLLGGAGLAAAALLGCTQDEDSASRPVARDVADPTSTPSPVPTTPPERRPVIPPKPRPAVVPLPSGASWDGRGGVLIHDPSLPYPYQWPEPQIRSEPGGTLVIASTIDVESMDPLHAVEGRSVTFPNMVYNRLLGMASGPRKDPFTVELEQEEVAWAWERSPDGATFTFHLREHVYWQNVGPLFGRQLVADDIRFAFERYRLGAGAHRAYWGNVGAILAPHPYTLSVYMANVTADFLVPLASRYHPIYPRELVDSGEIDSKAVGTGPMILSGLKPADQVAFVKNPDYWEHWDHWSNVLLDGVQFDLVPDHEERFALLREGKVDYALAAIASYEALEGLFDRNPDVQINLGAVEHDSAPLGLNLSNPTFADERVRQAITLALGPYLMAHRIYSDVARVLPLHPWMFTREERPHAEVMELGPWFDRHDPAEATKLLAAAGVEDLSFNLLYHDDVNAALDDIAEMAIEQLSAVGITVHAQRVNQSDFNRVWMSGDLPEASTSAFAPEGFDADHFFYQLVYS